MAGDARAVDNLGAAAQWGELPREAQLGGGKASPALDLQH